MKKEVIEAIMRLYKGWDATYRVSDNKKAVEKLLTSLIVATDYNECGISSKVADAAVKIWGTNVDTLNNTFHKSFATIENIDSMTLLYQQLLHYFTTYGAEAFGCFDSDNVYIPKEDSEIPETIRGLKLAVIHPFTVDEIEEKTLALANQNLGLSSKTLDDLFTLITYYLPNITAEEIAGFQNRELRIRLYNYLNVIPVDADEFLRFVIFKATGQSLLIKSKPVLEGMQFWIRNHNIAATFMAKAVKALNPVQMAQSYHRYHEYWLALKRKNPSTDTDRAINAFINKISKLADKHHRPLQLNVMQNILDSTVTPQDVTFAVEKASDAQLLKVWGYLHFIGGAAKPDVPLPRNYKIRNNTVWTKKRAALEIGQGLKAKTLIIKKELQKRFSHLDGKKFYVPENVIYPMFTSEKQTVGVIPQGTVVSLPITEFPENENLIIAIHWYDTDCESDGDNGRVDLDLHAIAKDGAIGWNSALKTEDCTILHSGDMTSAPKPHGATEAIAVKGKIGRAAITLSINNYTQNNVPVTFDIYITHDKADNIEKSYTVNHNKIITKFSAELAPGKSQQELGTLFKDSDGMFKFIIGGFATGNERVSRVSEVQNIRRQAVKAEFEHYPKFVDFISLFNGSKFVATPEEADYNLLLEGLSKNTFTSMLYPV